MSGMQIVSWKLVASHLAAIVLGIALTFMASFVISRYRHHKDIEQLQSQIQQDPKNADNWASLGYTESLVHDDTEAMSAFKKAIELDPANFQAYFGIGIVCERDGEYAAAEIWYGDALKVAENRNSSVDVLMVKEALKLLQSRRQGEGVMQGKGVKS